MMKNYGLQKKYWKKEFRYCEERDLDSWKFYMLSWKADETWKPGIGKRHIAIAENLLKNENQTAVSVKISALVVVATIKMRRGDRCTSLTAGGKTMAFETMELQRIIPVMISHIGI